MKEVSKKLKVWRGKELLTQAEAAARLGVPVRTYVNWEQGHRSPRGLALSALLERIK